MTTKIRTFSEMIADYEELNDFRNNCNNEEAINALVDCACRQRREIMLYPVSTMEDLRSKAAFMAYHIAGMSVGNVVKVDFKRRK